VRKSNTEIRGDISEEDRRRSGVLVARLELAGYVSPRIGEVRLPSGREPEGKGPEEYDPSSRPEQ
jgi:hypothetical protein